MHNYSICIFTIKNIDAKFFILKYYTHKQQFHKEIEQKNYFRKNLPEFLQSQILLQNKDTAVLISAAGKLVLPLMVVFCEPSRPACFDQQLRPFINIKAYSTSSGLMTSHLGILWLKDIFKPNAGENSILMGDSWTGYQQAIEQDNGSIDIHILPPKSTSVLQPLDVYFNRPFKNFLRLLSNKIRRFFPQFDLSNRVGMATLIDITIGQFSAPVFNPMIQYSWFASGYLEERPEQFETAVTVCFDSIKIDSKCHCDKRAFIKCAHCDTFYCFNHFVNDLHRCYV